MGDLDAIAKGQIPEGLGKFVGARHLGVVHEHGNDGDVTGERGDDFEADEISRIVKVPEIRDRFQALGAEPVGSTAEQFAAFYRNEVLKWGKVVKESGAQID